jgi:quinol monooxygenase YgiN
VEGSSITSTKLSPWERNMSYLRVTRSRVDPSRVDEAGKVVPDVVAAMRQLPGFQSVVVAGNRATGEAIAFSIFDTEEQARFTPDPNSANASKIQAAGIQMDPSEFFEVTTQA